MLEKRENKSKDLIHSWLSHFDMRVYSVEEKRIIELTRATSLSVLGVSSPGNLIIGEGRAFVA